MSESGFMGYSKKTIASLLIVAAIFISGIATTVLYYNGLLADENSKIASLNNQIANQNNKIADQSKEIANLTDQVEEISNFTDANLEATLGVSEVGNTSMSMYPYPFYRLYISGTVKNTGKGMALDAGLHAIAYASNGLVEINMAVPLANGVDFGTDNSTDAFVQSWDGSIPSLQLGYLASGQSVTVDFNIYHEGKVTNWTVTPVWWTPQA